MGNELADLMSRATNQLPVEPGIAEQVIERFRLRGRRCRAPRDVVRPDGHQPARARCTEPSVAVRQASRGGGRCRGDVSAEGAFPQLESGAQRHG
jgi:hypothetical protein